MIDIIETYLCLASTTAAALTEPFALHTIVYSPGAKGKGLSSGLEGCQFINDCPHLSPTSLQHKIESERGRREEGWGWRGREGEKRRGWGRGRGQIFIDLYSYMFLKSRYCFFLYKSDLMFSGISNPLSSSYIQDFI